MCVISSATSDSPVSWRHEDPSRREGRNPVQVFWSATHQLHLAEVQETSETRTKKNQARKAHTYTFTKNCTDKCMSPMEARAVLAVSRRLTSPLCFWEWGKLKLLEETHTGTSGVHTPQKGLCSKPMTFWVLTTIALFVQRAVISILVLLRSTLLLKVQQPHYVLCNPNPSRHTFTPLPLPK